MTDSEKKEAVYADLVKVIYEIIGEGVAEELSITSHSVFTRDLEMDSIEIVAFAEKVRKRYGDKVDFAGWLSKKGILKLLSLSLGDIVEFIVKEGK